MDVSYSNRQLRFCLESKIRHSTITLNLVDIK